MDMHSSKTGHLKLGYKIRRATLETCGGLMIFPHDLTTFAIPIQYAELLADTYKRYLWASGILDFEGDPDWDEQVFQCDRQTLAFHHERKGHSDTDKQGPPIGDGVFCLNAAIEFVWMETKLDKAIAVRWCLMMEYISYQDQRLEEKDRLAGRLEKPEVSND